MSAFLRFLGLPAKSPSAAESWAALSRGARLLLPTVPAMLIWASVTAVAMVSAGLSPLYVILINWTVYAGSAQLAVLSMLAFGVVGHHVGWGALPVIWLTALIVNLRFVIFSANIKPFFRHLPLRSRLLYGYLNGDVPMVLFLNEFKNRHDAPASREEQGVFVGLGLSNFVAWQVGIFIGVGLAALIPNDWGLSLAAALTLLILIVKMVDNWAGVVGCIAAALTAVWLHDLPNKLWVLCAIVIGVVAAVLAERVLPHGFTFSRVPHITEEM